MKNVIIMSGAVALVGLVAVYIHQDLSRRREMTEQLSALGARLKGLRDQDAVLRGQLAHIRTLAQERRDSFSRETIELPDEAESSAEESTDQSPAFEPVDGPALATQAFERAPAGGRWARDAEIKVRELVQQAPELADSVESLTCREGVCELMLGSKGNDAHQGGLLGHARELKWDGPVVGIPLVDDDGGGARILLARSMEDVGGAD